MENERLARAIARIEQATAKLDDIAPLAAPINPPTDDSALKAKLESLKSAHRDALDDRERTIAKLRADITDINALKDQEIDRLRNELQAAANSGNPAVSEAEHHALQQKYDRLHATAESTLSGLDGLISKVERTENG
jgi:hypothetical protein